MLLLHLCLTEDKKESRGSSTNLSYYARIRDAGSPTPQRPHTRFFHVAEPNVLKGHSPDAYPEDAKAVCRYVAVVVEGGDYW